MAKWKKNSSGDFIAKYTKEKDIVSFFGGTGYVSDYIIYKIDDHLKASKENKHVHWYLVLAGIFAILCLIPTFVRSYIDPMVYNIVILCELIFMVLLFTCTAKVTYPKNKYGKLFLIILYSFTIGILIIDLIIVKSILPSQQEILSLYSIKEMTKAQSLNFYNALVLYTRIGIIFSILLLTIYMIAGRRYVISLFASIFAIACETTFLFLVKLLLMDISLPDPLYTAMCSNQITFYVILLLSAFMVLSALLPLILSIIVNSLTYYDRL